MKTIIYLLSISIALSLLTSCGCDCDTQNTIEMDDAEFNEKFECLDIERLETIGEKFWWGDHYSYTYRTTYENGLLKNQVEGDRKYGYTQFYSLDTTIYISLKKGFHPNGKIKYKHLYNDLGFSIGKGYTFDSFGNLKNTIDYEAPFPFTFEELKKELAKEGVSLENLPVKKRASEHEYPIRILRWKQIEDDATGEITKTPAWYVEYTDPDLTAEDGWGRIITLLYDGRTGELIKREYISKKRY